MYIYHNKIIITMVDKVLTEVRTRLVLGKAPISSCRSNKVPYNFDDLNFVPASLKKRPVDYFRENIYSDTIIGKTSEHPLKLKTPIIFAGMSFGALSKEAKIALARASSIIGTVANTGEGGMLPEERKEAKLLIAQYSTARFGVDEKYIKSADAIEIKIGQGAKPGQGGLLPKEKVTKEIAKVRKLKKIDDIHSPPYHPDIKSLKDLKNKVEWLRNLTKGKPIILKLGSFTKEDFKIALKAGPDVIAIDGMRGGTGAAPEIMLNDFGTPIIPSLVEARKIMRKAKASQDLIVGGGFNKGPDVAKALALGADGVFMGTSLLVAMGCMQCRQCYKGICPIGITTQDPKLRSKFNMKKAVNGLVNYVRACTEEVKMAAGACGYKNIHMLNRKNLISLTEKISIATGIPMI